MPLAALLAEVRHSVCSNLQPHTEGMQEQLLKKEAQMTGLKGTHLPMNASGLVLPYYVQLLVPQTEEGEIFLQLNCGQRTLQKMAITFTLVIPTRIHQ